MISGRGWAGGGFVVGRRQMGRVRRRKIDLLRREMKRIKKSFTREQWWWTITIARLYICNSIHPLMWTSFRPKCVYLTLKKKKKKIDSLMCVLTPF